MKGILIAILALTIVACGNQGDTMNTVEKVDIQKFMGDWYVLAGRFTPLEIDVHNGLERYTWNQAKQRIDVDFTYNKGSLNGRRISIPQKAWIHNRNSNAHWKVSPLWPLKFNYLVVDLDENYRWRRLACPIKSSYGLWPATGGMPSKLFKKRSFA